jgi:putative ABC transport system substrate-binding protein
MLALSLGADMRRREFSSLLGGAAVAWPLAAHAQQSERVRRIGVLTASAADDSENQARMAAFLQSLAQSGWIDGRNVRIDTRWATTNADDLRRHASELAALAPDVILAASGTSTVAPLLQATRTVPIVFVVVIDPVGAGFVASLARPGGNATGFLMFEYGLSGKWLELLKQVARGRDASGGPARCGHRLRDRAVCRRPGGGAVLGGGAESGRCS